MSAQKSLSPPDRAIFIDRYTTALAELRDRPPDDRKLRSLKVLAQVCRIRCLDHNRIAKSIGLDDSGWVDTQGRTFSEWLSHSEAESRSRCGQCGMSCVTGSSICSFCGGPLESRAVPKLVGMSDASQLRLKEVYSGFSQITLVLAGVGGLLVLLGGLLAALAFM